jgi:hypothetical protein
MRPAFDAMTTGDDSLRGRHEVNEFGSLLLM